MSSRSITSISQARAVQSCIECRRRKIRCDKNVPCRACTERGDQSNCRRAPAQRRRHAPEPTHSSTDDIEALRAELAQVQRRLGLVEAELAMGGDDDSSSTPPGRNAPSTIHGNVAAALEDAVFDIGQMRDSADNMQSTIGQSNMRWFQPITLDACLLTLPSQRHCETLVDAYLTHLNWFCGCLHGPVLRTTHRNFWLARSASPTQETMFTSLLFSILSVTAYLLTDDQAAEAGYSRDELEAMAPTWFDCSYASFFRCQGMSDPSLLAVQSMVTLNYAFHLSGNSKAHHSMFGLNVGMARSIGIHLLGMKQPGNSGGPLRDQMGRRAWWCLVETEWSFTPYHRYSCGSNELFRTLYVLILV
jgi:hypothetical protein